jgi:hypothetical protein
MKRLTVFSAAVAVMSACAAGALAHSDFPPPAIAFVGRFT